MADVEKLKKSRKVHRQKFSATLRETEELSNNPAADENKISAKLDILQEKHDALLKLDKEIFQTLLENDSEEKILEEEMSAADKYKLAFFEIRRKIGRVEEGSQQDKGSVNGKFVKTLKLPKIQLKKYSGEPSEWLAFSTQFEKIHIDEQLDEADKFQYLLQTTVEGSRIRQVVDSYPATADNYQKVIVSIKNRFGRKELLIEFYIRQMLKLILNNKNMSPVCIYDQLETQFRALESLGINAENYSAILYPLVESVLPEDLLRVWQRHDSFKTADEGKARLENIMVFLRGEVECEENIALSKSFSTNRISVVKNKGAKSEGSVNNSQVPTALGLFSGLNKPEKKQNKIRDSGGCIFCNGNHATQNCTTSMSVQDRMEKIKANRCCFKCFKGGHDSKACKAYIKCLNCSRSHHILMCLEFQKQKNPPENPYKDSQSKVETKTEKALASYCSYSVLLQTTVVKLVGENNKQLTVRALIDTGSQRSYILQNLADRLNLLELARENIILSLFGGTNTKSSVHSKYKIKVESLDASFKCNFDVLGQKVICQDIPLVPSGAWIEDLERVGINIYDTKNRGGVDPTIGLLIGADIVGKLFTGRKYELNNGIVALETFLGWTLMGKLPQPEAEHDKVFSFLTQELKLADLWNLDSLGIKDPHEIKNKVETERLVEENFLKTVTKDSEGRYLVHLPWVEGHPPLPTNFDLASKRLETVLKGLARDNLREKYEEVIREWIDENIIEKIELQENAGHYLPHRPVIKQDSTFKIRPVFDASARQGKSPSLNSCLDKGPNLIEQIPNIMRKFRMRRYGVIADIKRAFLQISLQENDRNFLKFLWKDKEGNLEVYRHKRVVFGVSSSPFLLGAVIQYHLDKSKKYYEDKQRESSAQVEENRHFIETVDILKNSFYVDNCITSLDDKEQVNRFIRQSRIVFEDARFDLRGWETSIPGLSDNTDTKSSVLGMFWDRDKDVLQVNTQFLDTMNLGKITRRTVLSVAHKLFDVIGVTSPITTYPKQVLQQTWKEKIEWDEELEEQVKTEFCEWVKELRVLEKLEIPRFIVVPDNTDQATLHIFSDASQYAYAAAIFIRTETTAGVLINLIEARAKILPIKHCSTPRAELLAANIAARLYNTLCGEPVLNRLQAYFWTDSTAVLAWIHREENWGVFVQNRVTEIRTLTKKESWRHVPGIHNPADLPSRGCSTQKLLESRWWEGPQWLRDSPAFWPSASDASCDEGEVRSEMKKDNASKIITYNCIENDRGWYYKYFSKFEKIVRLVAWIRRFIHNARNPNNRKKSTLALQEMQEAEDKIFLLIQEESGIKEVALTEASFVDEKGILRLRTKLAQRKDSFDFRHPIILPKNHEVVKRIIFKSHVDNCHVGVLGLLSILRERFWILGGRREIRKVIGSCVVCKRYSTQHIETIPTSLPEPRTRDAAAFEIIGVDLAGPLYLRERKKTYIALFTCAVYRAVHLELLSSLSTESFIQGFRRFISRRGRPSIVYSDNGTNFLGTENALKKLDWEKILEFGLIKRIEWRFNPPFAAWWGGWWERLIRILKDLLKRVLAKSALSYEELLTVLCECEAVINSRPLTYVYETPEEYTVLTPVMYIQDVVEIGVSDLDQIVDGNIAQLSRRAKYLQNLRNDLKKRFRNEYLGQLIIKARKSKNQTNLKVGDIVLVGNDFEKRISWPLARVEELIKGKDGEVRVVKLKHRSGSVVRAVQRVYPLEQNLDQSQNLTFTSDQKVVTNTDPGLPLLPDQNFESPSNQKVTRTGRIVKTPAKFLT